MNSNEQQQAYLGEKFPGKEEGSFFLKFEEVDWIKKRDIITDGNVKCEVIKVYRSTLWRKLLLKLGFKVRLMEVKVKEKL